ncbi:MAG: PaaI family thioesterase [Vulcanimicrobiaceae bacterium]
MSVPIDDGNCFACGPDNPIGIGLVFEPDAEGGVRANVTLGSQFQGWREIAHGGIAMTLIDEAMAHAAGHAGQRGVTASVSVRFRKPVPLGVPLVIRGRVASVRRNVLFLEASVLDAAGVKLAEGDGKFVSMGALGAANDRRNPARA